MHFEMTQTHSSQNKVLISTTQRCGSTWIASICCKIMHQKGMAEYISGLQQNLLEFSLFEVKAEERIAEFSANLISLANSTRSRVFKTHDLPLRLVPLFLKHNPDFWVFNIVRDFRDVLVSRLMYNRYYLPTIGQPLESPFVENNPQLSDTEMVQQFYGTREMFEWLVQWKLFSGPVQHSRYLQLDYEQLLNPVSLRIAVESLAVRLMPGELSTERLDEITASAQFNKIDINLNRDREQREVKNAFCRKGIAGDHVQLLTKRQGEALKILMQSSEQSSQDIKTMSNFSPTKIRDVYPRYSMRMLRTFLEDYKDDVTAYLHSTNRAHYLFPDMFVHEPINFVIYPKDVVISASLFFKGCSFNKRNDNPLRDSTGQIPMSELEKVCHPIFHGTNRETKSFMDNYVWPLVRGERKHCKCVVFLASDLLCLKPILADHGINVIVMKHPSVAQSPGVMWRFLAFNFKCRAIYIADSDRVFEIGRVNRLLKILEENPQVALSRPLQSTGPGGQMALILGNDFMVNPLHVDFDAAENMLGYIALNILSEDRPVNFTHENLHGRKYFTPRTSSPEFYGPNPGERVPFKCFPYYGFDESWLKEVIYYHFSNGRIATYMQRHDSADLIQRLDLQYQEENGNILIWP